MKRAMLLMTLSLCLYTAMGQQSDKEKAADLKKEAIQIMDNGEPDKAITLLEEAAKLDRESHVYLYEMGFAYYLKKDYDKAAQLFRQTIKFSDVTDQCYQMLGNAYDLAGERKKARHAYQDGIKKFPAAGRLYMESGLLDAMENNYDQAILSWEKGVQVQPDYPSNYYRLAKTFAQSKQRIWAIFYGELFMNVERNSERTKEISALLFDTYKRSITITDSGFKLDMAPNVINLSLNSLKNGGLKFPFPIVYTLDFSIGLGVSGIRKEKQVTIGTLATARNACQQSWFGKSQQDKQFPNVLLDFQKTLAEKGWLDAYSYWLLMQGNESEFTEWRKSNEDTFTAFAAWFKDNPLRLDTSHYFVRTQYE